MQEVMNQVSVKPGDNYNIKISMKKTEVVNQLAHRTPYSEPTITVTRQRLHCDDKFCLGSTLSRAVHIDDEVTARIAYVSVAFANCVEISGIKVESGLTQS